MPAEPIGEPNLSQLMAAAIEGAGEDVRVCLPGVVTAVNMKAKRVDVQPAVKKAGAQAHEPIIQNVPICFPSSKKARITFPVEMGDDVLLVFSDRSLEQWLGMGSGKTSAPEDARSHDLTDAFAVPIDKSGISKNRTSSLSIAYEGGELELTAAGVANLLGAHINIGLGTYPLIKSTIMISAFTAVTGEIASAVVDWNSSGQQLSDVNTFINALGTAWGTLAGTLATWPSAKGSTE